VPLAFRSSEERLGHVRELELHAEVHEEDPISFVREESQNEALGPKNRTCQTVRALGCEGGVASAEAEQIHV
jgi:hypothetical protein